MGHLRELPSVQIHHVQTTGLLLLRQRHWLLFLWTGTSYEAVQNAAHAQPCFRVRNAPKDGHHRKLSLVAPTQSLTFYAATKRPTRATPLQMTRFHTDEYIEFLHRVTP